MFPFTITFYIVGVLILLLIIAIDISYNMGRRHAN